MTHTPSPTLDCLQDQGDYLRGLYLVCLDGTRKSSTHPASCQDEGVSPGFDLPSFAEATGYPSYKWGATKTPSSQNLEELVPGSPETTPSSCACVLFASSSVAGPALREELWEGGSVAEENHGMFWCQHALHCSHGSLLRATIIWDEGHTIVSA